MLDALGAIAVWTGLIMMLFGGLWFLVAAFRESILWGLGCLIFPVVQLVFLIVEWPAAKRPFFTQLWGVALILIGVLALEAKLPFVHGG
ncbi:MAG TPA: hypothetical protein VLX92_34155 [Kofleriaceae bacterium]|nr:hypothetical protein [Kofleriaceae bacterium]